MRKQFTVAILLLCFLGLSLFSLRQELILTFARWQITKFCQEKLSAPLKYSKLHFEKGIIVIEDLELQQTNSNSQSNFQSPRLEISFSVHPLKGKIKTHAELIDPQIHVLKTAKGNFFPNFELPSKSQLTTLHVSNGRLIFSNPEAAFEEVCKFSFTMDPKRSRLNLSFNDEIQNGFRLVYHRKSSLLNFTFENLNLHRSYRLIEEIFPKDSQKLYVSDGLVAGNLSIYPKEIYAEGELSLKNILLSDKQQKYLAAANDVFIEFHKAKTASSQVIDKSPLPQFIEAILKNCEGQVQIGQESFLSHLQNDKVQWEIRNVTSRLDFSLQRGLQGLFQGIINRKQHFSPIIFDLSSNMESNGHRSFQAQVDILTDARQSASMRFSFQHQAGERELAKIDLQHVSKQESSLFRDLALPFFPQANDIEILGGNVDANLEIVFENGKAQELFLKNFFAKDLYLQGFSTKAFVNKAEASAKIDLISPRPLSTLQGQFDIFDGHLESLKTEYRQWPLQKIKGRLSFVEGMLEKSLMEAQAGGIKTKFLVDWFNSKKIVEGKIQGEIRDLEKILNEYFDLQNLHAFWDDQFELNFDLGREKSGLDLDGLLKIGQKEKPQELKFQAKVEKSTQTEQERQEHQWLIIAHRVLQEFENSATSLGLAMASDWLQKEIGINGLLIRDGHFQANDLSLKKYLLPFIFPNQNIDLEGHANIEGSFDHKKISISYLPKNLKIENSAFRIENGQEEPEKASHFFDLTRQEHFGYLNLKGASYLEKKTQTLFEDISGVGYLNSDTIVINKISASSSKLLFKGQVRVDLRDPEQIDIDIETDSVSGKVPDLQQFLKAFANHPFYELPLSGRIYSGPKDCKLHFSIKDKQVQFDSSIYGSVEKGSYQLSPVELKDLNFNFRYLHEQNALIIEELNGFYKSLHASEALTLSSPKIEIWKLNQPKVYFDLLFQEKDENVARIAGQIYSEEDSRFQSVSFDNKLCQIGQIRPNIDHCKLKNWSEIQSLHAYPLIRLSQFYQDCKRLLDTGLFPIRTGHIQSYSDHKLYGQAEAKILYDREEGCKFSAIGEDLILNQNKIEHFFLSGEKIKEQWKIEQVKVDELNMSAELSQKEKSWDVDFLSLSYGKSLVVKMNGSYQKQELQGELELFESNLEHLDEFSYLQGIKSLWQAKGIVSANGRFHTYYSTDKSRWLVDAELNSSFRNLNLQGVLFENKNNIACNYSTEKGLEAKGLDLSINIDQTPSEKTLLQLDSFRIHNETYVLDGLHFSLTPKPFKIISSILEKILPSQGDEYLKISQFMRDAKGEEALSGRLDLELSPKESRVLIDFEDGVYKFSGKDHLLQNLSVQREPGIIRLRARYGEQGKWILAQSSNLNEGSLHIYENEISDPKPLKILWKRDQSNNFFIQKAEGFFSGLQFQLKQAQKNKTLVGKIAVDFEKASNLLDPNLKKKAQTLALGQGYELVGQFHIPSIDMGAISFEGKLQGKQFQIMRKNIDQLFARISYDQKQLIIQDMEVNDPAFNFFCKDIKAVRDREDWQVYCPLLEVKSLKPHLLRGKKASESKAITVKYAELRDIHGKLNQPLTYSGKGQLYFHNPAKKNLFHILFAIPNDLIARIGLDLNVLTPVMGTIDYELNGDKIFLTRFTDVYSDGQRSKFFLSKESGQSYVDLSGKLNIKIKMKQYNIIFKIAELFTISILGNLEKPVYTLQKQEVEENQDQAKEDSQVPSPISQSVQ